MVFVSSLCSTNEVNTAYGVSTDNIQVSTTSTQVSTASTQVSTANLIDATIYAFLANQPNESQLVHEDLEQIHEDDLEEMDLKWQLAILSMGTRKFFQKTSRKITINGSDTAGYDKSKVECFNCHKLGHFAREYDEVPTNMALMAFSDSKVHNDKICSKTYLKSFETLKTQLDDLRIEFNKSEFNLATYKRGLTSIEEQLVFYKKNEVIFYEQNVVLKRDISYKDLEINMLKRELEKIKQEKEIIQLKIKNFDNASKILDKLIGSYITDNSRECVGFVSYNAVPPPHTGLFSPPETSKNVSEGTSNEVRESPDTPLVEELVSKDKLEKKTVSPTTIEFVRPKQQEKPVRKPVKYAEMYSFDHVQANCNYHIRERMISGNNFTRVNYNYFAKQAHPSTHRNMAPRAILMKTGLRPLNTARPINTAHHKTRVHSARPMLRFFNLAQSTVKRPFQIRTTLTTKNFSQKVNTAKGRFYTARPKAVNTARPNSTVVNADRANQTSKNLMEDMLPLGEEPKEKELLLKDLLKLNSVLFTDTRCFVLSPDFKLADESQVLLKVPRKNNIYSVDMKNIVPKESFTCLVAKAPH
ncbi:ribonuclease H-like domain-containing protein [Tanacetum coccineum]